jgi:hypothetical protein
LGGNINPIKAVDLSDVRNEDCLERKRKQWYVFDISSPEYGQKSQKYS